MATIQAVVVAPDAAGRLALAEVDAPELATNEALVQVAAISLNRGEVRNAQTAAAGFRPGWDLAGTVSRAAADGSEPAPGTRVVGTLRAGAWAETVAVPTRSLAVLPAGVSFAQAATLPIAGLTAQFALAKYGGSLLGRTILVTGASGGAGNFAVQLATLAGARVVGLVRKPQDSAAVRAAGAAEVAVGEDGSAAAALGPYDLIVDSVGGAVLGDALSLLAPDGACVSFGTTAGERVTFDARRFYGTGGLRFYGLIVFHELEREPATVGLARLAGLVANGRLRPPIEVEAPWAEVGTVAQRLLDRGYTGKAVLPVGS